MRSPLASLALAALAALSVSAQVANPNGIPSTSPSNALPGAATSSPPAQSQSPTPAAAAPSVAETPVFKFLPFPTATACARANVQWDLSVDRGSHVVDIYAYNLNVDQAIPPATESSSSAPAPATSGGGGGTAPSPVSAPAANPPANSGGVVTNNPNGRALPQPHYIHLASRAIYNESVVKDQPANVAYSWMVNVPQGRYRFFAIVNNTEHTTSLSDPFTVVEGQDVSCINAQEVVLSSTGATGQPSTSPGAPQSSVQSGASPAGTAQPNAPTTSKKGISGGAIAGIVIGVIAAVILAVIAFICCRRAQRDRHTRAGGRGDEPQTPMRNLIGKRGGGPAGGMALASLGRNGKAAHGHDASAAELGEKPYQGGEHVTRNVSRGTVDDPFQTAPSTPIEEKMQPDATPTSSFGSTAPVASRSLAYDAPAVLPARGASLANSDSQHLQSPIHSEPLHAEQASELPYERDDVSAYGRKSTPTPVRLPAAPLAPSLPGSQPTTPNTAAFGAGVSSMTPMTTSARSRASHASHPSIGSALDSTQSHGPSAFQTASASASASTPSSPGNKSERKPSLRRKPVPRLEPREANATPTAASDNGHARESLQLPPSASIGDGPAGDEYGLNAALANAGLDRGLSFKLMPDPPLEERQ